jgi:hypothetical protein
MDIVENVATRLVEGSPLIVLLLLGAVAVLWRELKTERTARIVAVETYAASVQKIAGDYSEFSSVLSQLIVSIPYRGSNNGTSIPLQKSD